MQHMGRRGEEDSFMGFIRFYPMALSHGVQHVRLTTAAMKVNNFFCCSGCFCENCF